MKNKLSLNNKKRIFLKTTNKSIIYLASVLNIIRYLINTDISCLGAGVFAKNTSLEIKFHLPYGSRNFSFLDWYFFAITPLKHDISVHKQNSKNSKK